MYTISINIGFIWFGQMRRQLEQMQWEEPTLEWKESKGWLDKTFYVRGPRRQIDALERQFSGFIV